MKKIKFQNLNELEEAIFFYMNKRYETTAEYPPPLPISAPVSYEESDEIGEYRKHITKKKNIMFLRTSQIIKENLHE